MVTRTRRLLKSLKMEWQVLQLLLTPLQRQEQHLMVEMVLSAPQLHIVDLQRMALLAIGLWVLQ